MEDKINHPSHYVESALVLEPMCVSEHLSSRDGQIIQYVMRAGKKLDVSDSNAEEAELRDLQKAVFWLNRRRGFPMLSEDYGADAGVIIGLLAQYTTGLLRDTDYCWRGHRADTDAYFARLLVRLGMRIDQLIHTCYDDVEI